MVFRDRELCIRARPPQAGGVESAATRWCVRKLRVGIIDLVTKGPTRALYARVMHANLASIMPQVVGVWCEAEGHDVTFVCYTGFENLLKELPADVDLVFIGAFTEAALLAYALSNLFRSRGAVTVLGGPHARCYPEDARRYFDYVLGFTDRAVIREVLQDGARHRPVGMHRAAPRQPATLPGVRERWKFIEPPLRKAPFFKIVPMLGSLGCPYTCSFCIDSVVPYQPLDMQVLQDDLKFLRQQLRRPRVGWHDPNFGVRFDEVLDAIEAAAPPGSIDFVAESSLSPLSEPHVQRLRRHGVKAIFAGIAVWDLDNNHAMNVKPKNYEWRDFYDHVIGLTRYTFSGRAIVRRFRATRAAIPRWMNVVRAVSSEGFGRIRYHTELRQRLDTDQHLRRYFDQETTEIPEFYVERVRQDLGPLWQWLPEGALYHDHHAYLKSEEPQPLEPVSVS